MNTPEISVERYNHLLRSSLSLATEMGVSRNYISAMKFNGFRMPGGKASLSMARKFMVKCPEFKVREHPPGEPLPPDASCDTGYAPTQRHGRRKPSSAIPKNPLRTAASPQ